MDGQVVRPVDTELSALLRQFVSVRITETSGVDLGAFPFDRGLTLAFVFLNADSDTAEDLADVDFDAANSSLSDDLLGGVKAISKFIGDSERSTYYKLENRQIPAGKVGGHWVASKAVLRRFYARVPNGGRDKFNGRAC